MEVASDQPFAVLLRRFRIAAGFSQEQLAERAALSVQAVSALERGARRSPYRDTVDLLARALGLTEEEHAQLAASVTRRRGSAVQATRPDTADGNLPTPNTSFIGREQELLTVNRLLGATRLLTLTGAGGTGKTRLANQVTAAIGRDYPDGVWLVELAQLADPTLVPETLAAVMDVREERGRPLLETLSECLRDKELLLLLDNCEHLLEAAAAMTETLLRGCPRLRILATSREALGAIGETVWWVPSLSVPELTPRLDGSGAIAAREALRAEAVQLFCERAAAAHPAFALTDANAAAVAAICRRLDGIPLAIELAAARARILTPEQIAARLDARVRLLTGGDRDAPLRQQTLEAAIDWSYDLLTESERRLLERLSVFAGGCDSEAAESVCIDQGDDPAELFERLMSLVQKSLLLVQYRGETARYRLLETIRGYAAEKLHASGDADTAHLRAATWFEALTDRAQKAWQGPEEGAWLSRLERELDNLRGALQWSLDSDRALLGLRVALPLVRFWLMRGLLSEGRQWLTRLLTDAPSVPAELHARAAFSLGSITEQQGDFDEAIVRTQESLQLAREAADDERVGSALGLLGLLAWRRGRLDEATAYFEEALDIERSRGDANGISMRLNSLGVIAIDQGELDVALQRLQEALAIARTLGNMQAISVRLNNLALVALRQHDLPLAQAYAEEGLALNRAHGTRQTIPNQLRRLAEIHLSQGDTETAGRYATEALAVAREIGNRTEVGEAYEHLARVAIERGDYAAAQSHAAKSLRVAHDIGSPRETWMALKRLAYIARHTGQHDRAIRLFAASDAVRTYTGEVDPEGVTEDLERYIAEMQAELGETAVAAALREGATMQTERAVAYALAYAGGVRLTPT